MTEPLFQNNGTGDFYYVRTKDITNKAIKTTASNGKAKYINPAKAMPIIIIGKITALHKIFVIPHDARIPTINNFETNTISNIAKINSNIKSPFSKR